MKRLIVILSVVFALTLTVVAYGEPGTAEKPSVTFNDQEFVFEKTYLCHIMTIKITGRRNLNIQDSDHMTATMVYVGGLNPQVEINVLPASCRE